MKFKRICTVIVTISILLSLSSCSFIDELKSSHGYFTDETQTVIHFGGSEYILYKELFPHTTEYAKRIFITDKDIPVLLTQFVNNEYYINSDNSIIGGYSELRDEQYFIRHDFYDEFINILKSENFTEYCYYKNDFYNYEMPVILLSQQVKDAIEQTSKTKPIEIDDDDYMEYCLTIYKCDSGKKVLNEAFTLNLLNGNEYILIHSGYDYTETIYRIDPKYQSIFKDIAGPVEEIMEEYL